MAERQDDYMSDDPKKNPFATGNNKLPLTTKLILLLCGPFLVPWRIFFVIFFVWCHYMCALFGMLFPYDSKFRYWWMMNLKFWGRLMIFGFGHVWITESGKIDENVKCIVSNHVGYVDILYFLYRLSPSFIAKTEVKKVGMVGVIAQAIHCIFVDRKKKIGENEANPTEVKKNVDAVESGTAEIMKKWKQPGDRQKILLYPEGTTTNGHFLIHFHTGAFCMGEPVQPVLLRYNWDWKRNCSIEGKVHPAYSDISAVKHALYIMSQPYTSMHVEYMDVYYPNEEEKKDPKLYAENVRKVMAARLGVPTSEHTFKEKYAYQKSLKTRKSKKMD